MTAPAAVIPRRVSPADRSACGIEAGDRASGSEAVAASGLAVRAGCGIKVFTWVGVSDGGRAVAEGTLVAVQAGGWVNVGPWELVEVTVGTELRVAGCGVGDVVC